MNKYAPVSRRRLCNMLRWFKNKKEIIKIVYEYNNSRGNHYERSYIGTIKDFTVSSYEEYGEYKINVNFVDGTSMQEFLDSSWEFYNLGKLKMANSGPYCYFTINFANGKKEE